MPRRDDIESILLIGSGPIVIGQACEFDYSGTQGAKALKEEGYRIILVNSNPATIMTDPEFADRTYIEPLTPEILEAIIEREKPDALLPTLGGQTALNLALALADRGILEKHGVELIGANVDAIRKAEERELFKAAMDKIGLGSARADVARTVEDAHAIADRIGYPIILKASAGGRRTGAAKVVFAPIVFGQCLLRFLDSPSRAIGIGRSQARRSPNWFTPRLRIGSWIMKDLSVANRRVTKGSKPLR